jgi:5-methylcytosine-specific restriction endonuclease McrA
MTWNHGSKRRQQMVKKLYNKFGEYKCRYCGKELTEKTVTLDHVIPLAAGGDSRQSNLVFSCKECNKDKDDKYDESIERIPLTRAEIFSRIQLYQKKFNKISKFKNVVTT